MNAPDKTSTRFPTFGRVLRSLTNRRCLVRMGFVAACLLTLVGLFYAEENWRGARTLRSYRERVGGVEARGFSSLAPPPVADAENLARTPFFAPLFDFLPGTQTARDADLVRRTRAIQEGLPSPVIRPPLGVGGWWTGSALDLSATLEGFRNPRATATREAKPTQPVEAALALLETLRKAEPVLTELREAAARRTHCRFDLQYDNENPFAILLPHLAIVKSVCQILWMRASAELALNRTEAACDDVLLLLRLSDSVGNEPILISQLVRVATFNMAVQVIWEGLATQRWTEAQMKSLESSLNRFEFLPGLRLGLQGERVAGNRIIEAVRDGRVTWNELGSETDSGDGFLGKNLVFRLGPRGWLDLEQRNYNVVFDEVLGDAIDFEANHVRGLRSDEAARRVEEMLAVRSSLFSHQTFAGLLVPAVTRAARKLAQSEVGARQARVALAIERHRQAAGRLPETLDELVPKYMAKMPLDPCSGQPFRYRLTEGGKFLLYSVGWNEKDDGGAVVRKNESLDGQLDPTQGDWVWTY